MRVCLPMYDFPEVADATDALWQTIRCYAEDEGLDLPAALDRETSFDSMWTRDLLLGQCCGLDLAIRPNELRYVATPTYGIDGYAGHSYRSFIVVAGDSRIDSLSALEGEVLAANSIGSHSGYGVLTTVVGDLPARVFSDVYFTGAHHLSLAALGQGRASVAAIDCTSWTLLARLRPWLVEGVRIIATSPAWPAPPFVTGASSGIDPTLLSRAIARAFADPATATSREELFISGLAVASAADYAGFPRDHLP